jgi:PIN like domain
VIFFDRSIPRGVAEAVKQVREDACWLEDVFEEGWIKDREWIPDVGARGWLVVSKDKKIRTRPEERRAVKENNVGCFILNYRQPLTRWEILKLVTSTLDEMEEKFANTPRPFMYLIDRNGRFRPYDLSRIS